MPFANVVFLLGWLIAGLAVSMLLPALFAVGGGQPTLALIFLVSALSTGFVGGALIMAFRGIHGNPRRAESLMLPIAAWTLLPLFAAIPLYAASAPGRIVDAYFEAASGLTTTGASVFLEPENLANAILLWRSMLQWFGGLGSIVLVVAILAPLGVGGMELRRLPMGSGDGDRLVRRVRRTFLLVAPIYSTMTIVCICLLWATGFPGFHAICIGLTTVSTGGFRPTSAPISAYDAPLGEVVMVFFMLLGATSFALHRGLPRLRLRPYLADSEFRYLVIFSIGGGVVATITILSGMNMEPLAAIWAGVFTAVSLVTTSGFVTGADGTVVHVPIALAFVLVLIGGASASTAGGLKVLRIALLLRQGARELDRIVHPHSITTTVFDGRAIQIGMLKSVWAVFVAYVFSLAILFIILGSLGIPYNAALASALGALSNTGPVLELIGPAAIGLTYAEMPELAKVTLAVGMIAGRVEFLALLSLFNVAYWRF